MIKISNLTKIYRSGKDSKKAVDDLTFSVKRGEIFGLIGPNGAGKTTTIKLILGLLKPDNGKIYISGVENKNVDIKKIIGYLPENPVFPSYLNGFEFLDYMGSLYKIEPKLLKNRIKEVSELSGISQFAKKRISTYSKGMVQRLFFAQALINNPEILILDEPTNGLDPTGIIEFRNIVLNLKKDNKTIMISSHNLTELEKVCDRVGFLRDGEIRKMAEISELQNRKEMEIRLSEITQKLIEKLKEEGIQFSIENEKLFFEKIEEERVPLIIRLIDESGAKIKSINMRQESLEELYLKLVKEGK